MKSKDILGEMTPAQLTRRAARAENGQDRMQLEKAYTAAKAAGNIPRADQIRKQIVQLAAKNIEIGEAGRRRKGPTPEQSKANDEEWSKIENHWNKARRNYAQMPGGPLGDQIKRQEWERACKSGEVDEGQVNEFRELSPAEKRQRLLKAGQKALPGRVDKWKEKTNAVDKAPNFDKAEVERINAKLRARRAAVASSGGMQNPDAAVALRDKMANNMWADQKAKNVDRVIGEDCSAGATCSASVSSGVVGAIPGKKIKRESAPAQTKKAPAKKAPPGKEYTAHGRLVNKPKKDQDQAKNYTGNFGESEMIKRSAIGEGCDQAITELDRNTIISYRKKARADSQDANMSGDRDRYIKRNKGINNACRKVPDNTEPRTDNGDRGYGKGRYMGDSVDPNLTELDNGPGGRTKTDKINYDSRRNSSGGNRVTPDELASRRNEKHAQAKMDAAARRKGSRAQEREWAQQDAREEQIELGDNFKFADLKRIASEYAGAHDIIDVVGKRSYMTTVNGVRVAGFTAEVYCDYDLNDMGYDQETIDKHGQDGHTSDMITLKFARDPKNPKKIIFTGFGN